MKANTIIIGLMIITAFAGLNHLSNTRIEHYMQLENCIRDMTVQEQFTGSYQAEWDLFASTCNNLIK